MTTIGSETCHEWNYTGHDHDHNHDHHIYFIFQHILELNNNHGGYGDDCHDGNNSHDGYNDTNGICCDVDGIRGKLFPWAFKPLHC